MQQVQENHRQNLTLIQKDTEQKGSSVKLPCKDCLIFPICKTRVKDGIYNIFEIGSTPLNLATNYDYIESQTFFFISTYCTLFEKFIFEREYPQHNYQEKSKYVSGLFGIYKTWAECMEKLTE
jgi:hypothetical protein